jgi:hypothetical protein
MAELDELYCSSKLAALNHHSKIQNRGSRRKECRSELEGVN